MLLESFEPLVGDSGRFQLQLLETGQFRERDDAGVTNLGAFEVELLELGQATQVLKALVADRCRCQIEYP